MTSTTLMHHEVRHTRSKEALKPHVCDACSHRSTCPRNLRYHYVTKHNAIKDLFCPLPCKVLMADINELKLHITKHHADDIESLVKLSRATDQGQVKLSHAANQGQMEGEQSQNITDEVNITNNCTENEDEPAIKEEQFVADPQTDDVSSQLNSDVVRDWLLERMRDAMKIYTRKKHATQLHHQSKGLNKAACMRGKSKEPAKATEPQGRDPLQWTRCSKSEFAALLGCIKLL